MFLAMASLVTTLSFWVKSHKVASLLDQYRFLLQDSRGKWGVPLMRAIFVLLPTLIYVGQFSVWYVDFMDHPSPWLNILFVLSMSWSECVIVVPVLYYTILGSLLSEALSANNEALSEAVREVNQEAPLLRKIQRRYLTLRRLYGEMENIVSVPLFAFDCNTAYTLINTVFYVILVYETNGNHVYIPANLVAGVLTTGVILLMGHLADTITRKVSNVCTLYQEKKNRVLKSNRK